MISPTPDVSLLFLSIDVSPTRVFVFDCSAAKITLWIDTHVANVARLVMRL